MAGAALLAAAVVLAVGIVAPPPPPMASVVVAAADIPAGVSLTAGDVAVTELPGDAAPPGALSAADPLVGRTLRIGVPRGTPLTEPLLLDASIVEDAPTGTVVTAVTLAGPGDATLAEPGRAVGLVGTDARTGETLTIDKAHVLSQSRVTDSMPAVSSPTNTPEGVIVYVAVRPEAVKVLRGALASGPVSVIVTP